MNKKGPSREDIQLILELLGDREVVAFRPKLARALGSTLAALFLCQATYWQSIKKQDEYWFKLRDAKRNKNGAALPPKDASKQSWEWELGMTRAEQEGARRLLKKQGLLEEKKMGVPAKIFYRVDTVKLYQFLTQNLQLAESDQLDGELDG